MSTEAGKMVGIAFEAIRQCHRDAGRMISDLDAYMTKSGLTRLGSQDSVTWGISRSAYSTPWMAKQLYRTYHDSMNSPNIVEGINISFFTDSGDLREPRLVVGRIAYNHPSTTILKLEDTSTWDLDTGYDKWCNATQDDFGTRVACKEADNGRILHMCAIACDLYSVQSIEDVKSMFSKVRDNPEKD